MHDQVKVVPIEHTGSENGISDEELSPEQVTVLRDVIDLMATISDQDRNDPGIKLLEKAIGIRWGQAAMRAIQGGNDGEREEREDDADMPDLDADPAGLTVVEGAFQGMSLKQSLKCLVRHGKASLAEFQKMSLESPRSVAIFLESRKAMPGTYQDGHHIDEEIYRRHFPKSK